MQCPKYGQNYVRVTVSDYGKWHKKAQQMERNAIGYIIRKLLIDGIIPAVLVLFNYPFQFTIAHITIF